jgi:hypothetical protein
METDIFVDVVPVYIHSEIACAAPVLGAFVVFLQDSGEVLDVFRANVFDAKVINTECEGYQEKIVSPKAGCDGILAITMLVQALFEELLCKDACLREAIHPFLDF